MCCLLIGFVICRILPGRWFVGCLFVGVGRLGVGVGCLLLVAGDGGSVSDFIVRLLLGWVLMPYWFRTSCVLGWVVALDVGSVCFGLLWAYRCVVGWRFSGVCCVSLVLLLYVFVAALFTMWFRINSVG